MTRPRYAALMQGKKPRRSDEEALQRSLVAHLRLRADPRVIWLHIPNAPRSKVAGARLKAMGMLAGAPDLMFVLPDRSVCFLELKKPAIVKGDRAGKLSASQVTFAQRCEAIGIECAAAYTIDQAVAILEAWGVISDAN